MTRDPWSVLTEHQTSVARRFLADRESERRHLVIYLSGAHAYGFPSPDSDLDLKCVHVAATGELVGLTPYEEPPDAIEVIDGVELDYGSNELGGVLRGCIKGNGNYLERILGELALGGDAALLADARDRETAAVAACVSALWRVRDEPAAPVRREADGQARPLRPAHHGDRSARARAR